MKLFRIAVVASVLFVAQTVMAFNVGDMVIVIDQTSPDYLHIGTVLVVTGSGATEVDTISTWGDFAASQLKMFIRIPPRK
jgi:hypothetical protein